MTITDAFKLFVKELTGTEPKGTTIADVVENGAALINGDDATEEVFASEESDEIA